MKFIHLWVLREEEGPNSGANAAADISVTKGVVSTSIYRLLLFSATVGNTLLFYP